ncbi:2'-5' RNA ligase family protein [Nocardioides marmorisolisilvae]|uniref:2'-5' RNA ligase family protein n=1 Tax=Nocardioides marmorisolisilvae TaxID=1542737 RepID=UPI00160A22AB|nr:2'-5' RNA ligase family protein [Nocardioides marmorisolisilvae]
MEELPITGIVIPVAEADRFVQSASGGPRRLPGFGTVPAHITLLAPFLPEEELDDATWEALGAFFDDVTPFGFELTDVCEFPGGVTYLSPEPAGTFRRLTQELHKLFPEFPPYGGAFDEIVPHLTVPLAEGENMAALTTALTPGLPLAVHASAAAVFVTDEDGTRVLGTLPFGNSAA